MKRRSIFQALMAAIPLALIGRKAEAEAEPETYEFKGLSFSVDYSKYACPECESFTLVYGPINQDIFTCDSCGTTVSALDVIAGRPSWQTLDYPEEGGIVRYYGYDPLTFDEALPIGIEREASPWWRNRIAELPHKNPDDPSWKRIT